MNNLFLSSFHKIKPYTKKITYNNITLRKFTLSSELPPIFNNEFKERLLKHPHLMKEINALVIKIEKSGLYDRNNPTKPPNFTALLMNPGIMKDMASVKKTFEDCGFSPYELQQFIMSIKNAKQSTSSSSSNTNQCTQVTTNTIDSEKKQEYSGMFDRLKGLFGK